ncbi:hypothetical protein JCM10213v2_008449 [Rhodosporidiobolus nylandii]
MVVDSSTSDRSKEVWRGIVNEFCANPRAPLTDTDAALIKAWGRPEQRLARFNLPPAPPVHDKVYQEALRLRRTPLAKLMASAGRARVLRLLNTEFGGLVHPEVRDVFHSLLADLPLAYLALHYRLPHPEGSSVPASFAAAFFRYCAAVDLDSVLQFWLKDVLSPTVFPSIIPALQRAQAAPGAAWIDTLYVPHLLEDSCEVQLTEQCLREEQSGDPAFIAALQNQVDRAKAGQEAALEQLRVSNVRQEAARASWPTSPVRTGEPADGGQKGKTKKREREAAGADEPPEAPLTKKQRRALAKQEKQQKAEKAKGTAKEAPLTKKQKKAKARLEQAEKAKGIGNVGAANPDAHLTKNQRKAKARREQREKEEADKARGSLHALSGLFGQLSGVDSVSPAQAASFKTWLAATEALSAALQK